MFNDPQDAAFTPLTYATTKSAQEQFSIIGGLYATEVLRTLHTPYLKQTQAVCLLWNVKSLLLAVDGIG